MLYIEYKNAGMTLGDLAAQAATGEECESPNLLLAANVSGCTQAPSRHTKDFYLPAEFSANSSIPKGRLA